MMSGSDLVPNMKENRPTFGNHAGDKKIQRVQGATCFILFHYVSNPLPVPEEHLTLSSWCAELRLPMAETARDV